MQRESLHELLRAHAYRHAVITTFAFSLRFFEDYALEKFRALQENGNISILIDRNTYEQILESAETDSPDFPKKANLRYLLQPVRVGRTFHPKIFLFAGKDRGLLIIGSANLTRDGLGSNAEMVSAFRFRIGDEEDKLPLFRQALDYIWALNARSPSEQLESNLRALEREASWIAVPEDKEAANLMPRLIHNLDRPLIEQLAERVGANVRELHVLSRYYDSTPALLDRIYGAFALKSLRLYTQNAITTLTAAWLDHPSTKKRQTTIQLCRFADHDHIQPLHAKAYAFQTKTGTILAQGSANFTTAALCRTARDGNAEILIVYPELPQATFDPRKFFDPEKSAVNLTDASRLITAPQDASNDEHKDGYERILESAVVDEKRLILRLADGAIQAYSECVLQKVGKRPISLPIRNLNQGQLFADLSDRQASVLKESATVARIVLRSREGGPENLSNGILVSNLQDLVTGRNIRRERQVAEARESPAKFISLLNELCKADDEDRLKNFLTYCDIPLQFVGKPLRHVAPYIRDLKSNTHELRDLGARNIAQFQSLDEAVIHFVERHRSRLDRHIESGTADGIANFAHILLTVAGLLINQIERLLAGFESSDTVTLTPAQWHEIRDRLNDYYQALADLLELTARDYLDGLLSEYPKKLIRDRFLESLSEIEEVWARALTMRDRLNELQKERLEISGPRPIRGPGFFKSVLSDENWREFAANLKSLQKRISATLAA
jgi:hypothetical protein